LLILLFLVLLAPQITFANSLDLDLDSFNVIVDGQVFKFMQPAILEGEEVYFPMRSFFSIFGVQIAWNEKESSTTVLADENEYLIDIDLANSQINSPENSTIPIKIINDQTYIPMGFLKDILNFHFSWDSESKSLNAVRIPESATIFKNLPEVPQYEVVETFSGIASWYGGKFHGRKTNSGEIFDENGLTAAHRTLPFDTYLRVTFLKTNDSTIVRINDRGPHVAGRILDLSKGAAEEIGLRPHGLGEVKIEVLAYNQLEA